MTTNTTNPLKPKRFRIAVSPEYAGGKILIVTQEEHLFLALGILALEEARFGSVISTNPELYDWAESVAKEKVLSIIKAGPHRPDEAPYDWEGQPEL